MNQQTSQQVKRPDKFITLTIPPMHQRVLTHWASVTRTMNESKKLLSVYHTHLLAKRTKAIEEASTQQDADSTLQTSIDEMSIELEAIEYNLGELEELEPPLNWLHMTTRGKLWDLDRAVLKAEADALGKGNEP